MMYTLKITGFPVNGIRNASYLGLDLLNNKLYFQKENFDCYWETDLNSYLYSDLNTPINKIKDKISIVDFKTKEIIHFHGDESEYENFVKETCINYLLMLKNKISKLLA